MSLYKLKGGEAQLLADLHQNVDHFDNADAPMPMAGNSVPAKLAHQKGNPVLTGKGATYALQNLTFAYTVAAGAFTRINYSALPSGAQGILIFYSVNDFNNGYQKAKGLIQLPSGFAYGAPFVYGRDYPTVLVNGVLTVLDATASSVLQNGDVVVPTTIRSGGVDYVILSVHRCQQVPYATLLQAGVSNSFNQRGIRYILQDETTAVLTQYTLALYNFDLSSFGKFNYDSTDINSNNQPDNFKKNVIDVPLTMGIIKSSGIVSAVNLASITGNSLIINFSSFVSNAHNPQD